MQVFAPESGQERLYTQAVSPIVEEVLEGFNCTIFAYGQTGTGKTYTMEGGDRDSADGNNLSEVAGVIPRAIHQIFTTLDHNDSEYTVKCRHELFAHPQLRSSCCLSSTLFGLPVSLQKELVLVNILQRFRVRAASWSFTMRRQRICWQWGSAKIRSFALWRTGAAWSFR